MSHTAALKNAHAKPQSSSGQGILLQRKCACGGSAGLSGECEECGKKKMLGIQTKLAISQPGDQYEQEADRVAEQVMQAKPGIEVRPIPTHSHTRPISLQRQEDEEEPDPLTEGLGTVAENLGENNPAFSVFTESLAAEFLAEPPELSIGVPVFLGANYAFLWGMAMANPAMRRHFDDFNLALLPGIVPQFPVKTLTYRILNEEQTRFEFDFGLDASALLEAFNEGVLNTRISTLSFESTGGLDTEAASPLSLSALQVNLGLFDDGLMLSGGFRSGVSPYPLLERDALTGETSRIVEQVPPLPDLFPERQDVRFLLQLDVVRLYNYFNPDSPPIRSLPLELEGDVVDQPLQRKPETGDDRVGIAPAEAVHPVLSSPGQPLDGETQRFMESRFGYDFIRVRVHTDAKAAESARAVDALAYAVGRDVVFGAGQYQPNVSAGQKLIAHELVHTIQQRGSALSHTVSRISETGGFLEAEADRAAHTALDEKVPAISNGPSVLARQEYPEKEIPGPSATLPGEEEEKFEETLSTPRGREKINAPSTWGWGTPETDNAYQECAVAPMGRERFLKFLATLPKKPPQPQRRKDTDGPKLPLAATWPDLAAGIPPKIAAEPVEEDGKTAFRLKPTHAEMPPIKSARTNQAEPFQEGQQTFMVFNADGTRVCPDLGGIAPLFWRITEGGAKKLWAGEMEHCSDIRAAFDVTLALYASAINREAAAERRYRTEKSAIAETRKRLQGIPLDPVDMLNEYGHEIEKTRQRDTAGWHVGVPSQFLKPQQNNCRGFLGTFSATSFPEVGDGPGAEKHSPQEVLQGAVGKVKGKP